MRPHRALEFAAFISGVRTARWRLLLAACAVLASPGAWAQTPDDAACKSADPRAYVAVSRCKIANVSQSDCASVHVYGGTIWYPGFGNVAPSCGFVVPLPQIGRPSGGGALGGISQATTLPGASRAAGTVAALGNLLGAANQLHDAWNGVFGRDPERDGDLVPGGLAPLSARALDAIALEALMGGIALEGEGLEQAADAAYARAAEAAARAGDGSLLQQVRERQIALACRDGIGLVLSTGQNPQDRFAKYQALRASCTQSNLAALLEALIAIERDRLPPGADTGQAAAASPPPSDDLRRRLAKAIAQGDSAPVGDDVEPPAPPAPAQPGSAPATGDAPQVPDDDLVLARAASQQDSRRRIFCGQTEDAQGCMANPTFCIGAYANDRARYDACSRAFHDPDIWYDAMRGFWSDPAEMRRGTDALLRGALDDQFR